MPIYVRLIIMIGEIIGLGIASFLLLKKDIKLAEAEHELKLSFRDVITSSDTLVLIILNIINICIFIFSFYNLRFCSYHKLVLVSSFTIFSILFITTVPHLEKHVIVSFTAIISFVAELALVSAFIASLIVPLTGQPTELIPVKKVINEENDKIIIHPMNLTKESLIGYVEDDDAYVFFYQDDSGYHLEDDCKAEVVLIADTEDSYLEKHTSTKTFLNEERRTSSDDYITEEKETSFVLYLNEKQLIELTD